MEMICECQFSPKGVGVDDKICIFLAEISWSTVSNQHYDAPIWGVMHTSKQGFETTQWSRLSVCTLFCPSVDSFACPYDHEGEYFWRSPAWCECTERANCYCGRQLREQVLTLKISLGWQSALSVGWNGSSILATYRLSCSALSGTFAVLVDEIYAKSACG